MVLMHKKCMDVAFETQVPVIKEKLNEDFECLFYGSWINLGYTGNPWYLIPGYINISLKNYSDWVDITNSYTNVRSKPGLP